MRTPIGHTERAPTYGFAVEGPMGMLLSRRPKDALNGGTSEEEAKKPSTGPIETGSSQDLGMGELPAPEHASETPMLDAVAHEDEQDVVSRWGDGSKGERGISTGRSSMKNMHRTERIELYGRTPSVVWGVTLEAAWHGQGEPDTEAFIQAAHQQLGPAIAPYVSGEVPFDRDGDERIQYAYTQALSSTNWPRPDEGWGAIQVAQGRVWSSTEWDTNMGNGAATVRNRYDGLPLILDLHGGEELPIRLSCDLYLTPMEEAEAPISYKELHQRRKTNDALILLASLHRAIRPMLGKKRISWQDSYFLDQIQARLAPDLEPHGWRFAGINEFAVETEKGESIVPDLPPELFAQIYGVTQGGGALSVMASSRADQVSYERDGGSGMQGDYTRALLNQMNGGISATQGAENLNGSGQFKDQEAVSTVVGGASGSNPDGTKRSVHVGVSDYDHINDLEGPLNDIQNLGAAFSKHGFEPTLLEDPTLSEMEAAYAAGIDGLQAGDSVVLSFSGHGSRSHGILAADHHRDDPRAMMWGSLSKLASRATAQGVNAEVIVDACYSGEEVETVKVAEDAEFRKMARAGGKWKAFVSTRAQLQGLIDRYGPQGVMADQELATRMDEEHLASLATSLFNYLPPNLLPVAWTEATGLDASTLNFRAKRLQDLCESLLRGGFQTPA